MLVMRHLQGKKEREIIHEVQTQAAYVKYVDVVDWNDRDSAD